MQDSFRDLYRQGELDSRKVVVDIPSTRISMNTMEGPGGQALQVCDTCPVFCSCSFPCHLPGISPLSEGVASPQSAQHSLSFARKYWQNSLRTYCRGRETAEQRDRWLTQTSELCHWEATWCSAACAGDDQ